MHALDAQRTGLVRGRPPRVVSRGWAEAYAQSDASLRGELAAEAADQLAPRVGAWLPLPGWR